MSSYGITVENLLSVLPAVLRNDDNMLALATSIATILQTQISNTDKARIYPNIDELPEAVLDILADDFKVDWYGYDYGIEAKRAIIRDCFHVHRVLGTRGAVEKALSDIYPGSEVEEWNEYGGEPFYFRVLLDVTRQRVAITHAELVRTINIYKSLRSHLQDDAIIYRSRCGVVIQCVCGFVVYTSRACGTFPERSTQGSIEDGTIGIGADNGGTAYSVKMCGTALGSVI